MQLAGQTCAQCSKSIVFQDEGTWCPHCGAILHQACISGESPLCPSCQSPFESPQSQAFQSIYCPNCLLPSPEATTKTCPHCGFSKEFDDPNSYLARKNELQKTGASLMTRGCCTLAGGLLLMLIALVLLFPHFQVARWIGGYEGIVVLPLVFYFKLMLGMGCAVLSCFTLARGFRTFGEGRAARRFR